LPDRIGAWRGGECARFVVQRPAQPAELAFTIARKDRREGGTQVRKAIGPGPMLILLGGARLEIDDEYCVKKRRGF
jgi:hypothetical protein